MREFQVVGNEESRPLEYAREHGKPLGLRSLETEKKADVSKRTENRLIEEKSIEVAQELRELLYGAIDLQRPDMGTQYATTEFLGMESLLCSETCAESRVVKSTATMLPRESTSQKGRLSCTTSNSSTSRTSLT